MGETNLTVVEGRQGHRSRWVAREDFEGVRVLLGSTIHQIVPEMFVSPIVAKLLAFALDPPIVQERRSQQTR